MAHGVNSGNTALKGMSGLHYMCPIGGAIGHTPSLKKVVVV